MVRYHLCSLDLYEERKIPLCDFTASYHKNVHTVSVKTFATRAMPIVKSQFRTNSGRWKFEE